jgi:hypothetical protein
VRRVQVLVSIALASAFAACASDPANQIALGHAGAPGVGRILLCPMNLVVALRPEIQNGSQPVDHEVVGYLESQGKQVSRLGLIDGRKLWKQAVADAKAAGEITLAPKFFTASLAQNHAFDAVVMPSLILLQTRMDASVASWDGVTRRLNLVDAPNQGTSPSSGLSGPAWVASLHVLAFDAGGVKVFEGRGGIDFVQEIEIFTAGRSVRSRMRPNASIFRDSTRVNEGVVQAFTPWLTPPDA